MLAVRCRNSEGEQVGTSQPSEEYHNQVHTEDNPTRLSRVINLPTHQNKTDIARGGSKYAEQIVPEVIIIGEGWADGVRRLRGGRHSGTKLHRPNVSTKNWAIIILVRAVPLFGLDNS